MTVKLLVDWKDPSTGRQYRIGNLLDTDDYTEAGLIASKQAQADLTGGTAQTDPVVNHGDGPVVRTNAAGTALVVGGRPAYQQRHDGSVAAYGKWGQPPALLKKRLFSQARTILPFDGSITLNDNYVAGGTVTPSIDSTTLFKGRPTYKAIVSGGTGVNFQLGVQGATTSTIPVVARSLATNGFVVAVKPPAGIDLTAANTYLGNADYSLFKARSVLSENPNRIWKDADGWTYAYFAGDTEDASYVSGPGEYDATFATPVRWKIRFEVANTGEHNGTWHVGGIFTAPTSQVPTVLLTCDDGYDELHDWLAPACKERGIPLSLSIDAGYIDTAGYMTTAQLAELMADESGLFEATNHGKLNQSYATVGLTQYLANMAECDALLASVGAPENGRKCAVYVQGSYDATLIASLRALGYRSAREVGSSTGQRGRGVIAAYRGNEVLSLPALCNLQSGVSVATVTGYIETAKARNNAVCAIMGHKFGASAATQKWIAGYDATHGMLNLLDYLADERDAGGILMPGWGNWAAGVWDESRSV